MAKPKLFISYRRSDAIDVVRALYFQLRLRFGLNQVFMDVSAITAGDIWPNRLRIALSEASVVLVVIGPTWLRSADQFGRRRLDLEGDWVRQEIKSSLDQNKTVIPLLVGGARELPTADALPSDLTALLSQQPYVLDDAQWEDGVQTLSQFLTNRHGLQLVDQTVVYPIPEKEREPLLGDEQLFAELQTLRGWEPVESFIPRDYPRSRHELRRGFRFKKFKHAITFLQDLIEPLNKINHHPRIENQWRTVFIHFTTWDVGNRLTALDIQAARIVDRVYTEFCARLSTEAASKSS